jgi:glucose-6-phosphate 1-dehydrogenase
VLALKKRLPENYAIVGYARTEMSDKEFKALVEESVHAQMPEVNKKTLDEFLSHVHYVQGQYDDVKDFEKLAKTLKSLEKGWKNPVRLTYLSIPPTVFAKVVKNIEEGGVKDTKTSFRCIVEKPIGHDLASFEEIHTQLRKSFTDDEIYLLDHYLGKDAVRNVYYLRFANPILERLLRNSLIHHVEVTASESYGLEGRSGYFEHTGILRDMVQSHMLLMLSLMTMPLKESEATIRETRLNALSQLYLPPTANLDDVILQGQYTKGKVHGETVTGYQDEDGVTENSRTNTFVALKLLSREWNWQGVPFYLRSGKRLGKKETRISMQFQEPHVVGEGSTPNRLDIILQGEAGMRIHLQTKIGGTTPAYRPLILEDPLVCMGDCLPEHGQLLLEAIHGKQTWFLTFDEVRTAWRLIDPLQHHLEKASTPLHQYPAGGMGPEEAVPWAEKDRVKWMA